MFMGIGPLPHEEARLAALRAYRILDTDNEEAFDRIIRLGVLVFGAPVIAISLVDNMRRWFKSAVGLPIRETTREHSFCRFTIKSNEPMIVEDATLDPRFANNPLVNNDPKIRFYAGAPLKVADGVNIGSFCVLDFKPRTFSLTEIEMMKTCADLTVEQLELRRRADVDWLTGAGRKETFYSFGANALANVTSEFMTASVMIFDLDHFKSINDRYGHIVGDEVLTRVIRVCQSGLRRGDQLARMGGEEFAVIMPGVNVLEAAAVSERLRAAVAAIDFTDIHPSLNATASFGVSEISPQDRSISDALLRADEALYESKRLGRNRVSRSDRFYRVA